MFHRAFFTLIDLIIPFMMAYFHTLPHASTHVLPEKFTYPFYYKPHPLAILASEELQNYLAHQTDFKHNFGLTADDGSTPIGKMFGVLVVKNKAGEIGFLAAFSGKLAESNQHAYFVPPVFDMLEKQGFFLQQEERLNEINRLIEELESKTEFQIAKTDLSHFVHNKTERLLQAKQTLKANKNERKAIRIIQKELLSSAAFEELEADLIKQSLRDKHEFSVLSDALKAEEHKMQFVVKDYENEINALKLERKTKSNALQNQLFDQYQFLNRDKTPKGLREIFETTAFGTPPAAAGECAAPKLLQYAFANGFIPVCMAEFWWGNPPISEIRQHKNYYPACSGKCEPILAHMLEGTPLDDNPLLVNLADNRDFEVVYQDDDLLVLNKPEDFLSVPGIAIQDSIYSRVKHQFPKATGPLIVHRLDMATSGLLVLALNKEAHKKVQSQFIKRKVEKRYIALLDQIIKPVNGEINLPLRGDLDDRPRQMVCFTDGKPSRTKFEVLAFENGKTRIRFFPITGRTHQLRMHAAHPKGLNAPIVGDDLYGHKAERLYLHAEYLSFIHPTTREILEFSVDPNF